MGHEDLQARPRYHELQRPVPFESVYLDVYVEGLPGNVYVLSVAANAFGPPLETAFERRHPGRSEVRSRSLSAYEGNLLRRRHLQLPQRADNRALRETEAAELHVVMYRSE